MPAYKPKPPAPAWRPGMPALAPYLLENGRCSDCNVKPMLAGGDELLVCPRCYGLLWRSKRTEDERRQQRLLADAAAEEARNARLERAKRREELHAEWMVHRERFFKPTSLSTSGPDFEMPDMDQLIGNKDAD